MATALNSRRNTIVGWPGWFLLAAALIAFFGAIPGQAVTYSGNSTGYAFGNLYGSAGVVVGQGDFANHLSAWCPGDPAAYWPYGTVVTSVSPSVVTLDGYGNPNFRTAMRLEDIGDPSCSFGNYWADWYFGRYKRSSDVCDCNNGGGDVCYTGFVVNNCSHATSWGVVWSTYDK